MKNLIMLLLCLVALSVFGQDPTVEFDAKQWKAPYHLDSPKDWDVERFLIPISFAPQIPYKGVEDIRFTPGWAKAQSDEYWSYAFLWYLDGTPKTTAKIIKNNLKAYYSGLVGVMQGEISADKLVDVKSKFKKVKAQKGDLKTFRGTIYMLDYMAKKPILLHCVVHLKSCSGQDKTYIFYEISPKPYSDKVWQNLHQLWTDFSCDNAQKTSDL
jgi:hypothetical protein